MAGWPGSPDLAADDDAAEEALDMALARVQALTRVYYDVASLGSVEGRTARWFVAARNAAALAMIDVAWRAAATLTIEAPSGRSGHVRACTAAGRLAQIERAEWRRIAGQIAGEQR